MSDVLTKNKAPSFILYILSFNLFLLAPNALILLYNSFSTYGCVIVCSTSAEAIKDNYNGTILLGSTLLTGLEMFMFRRGFGKKAFTLSMFIELGRLYSVSQMLMSMDNQLYVALSGASLISVFLSKVFARNVNDLLKRPISQNLGQIIPAIIVILIFTGSSFLSVLGLGVASQVPNPKQFDTGNINLKDFKTPSWNAQYFLDNILDKFRAGMYDPFKPVFNVTNNSPDPIRFGTGSEKISSYLKENTYFQYRYDPQKAKSGTFFPAETGKINTTYYKAGTTLNGQTYSKPVPDSFLQELQKPVDSRNYNVYNLTITTLVNHTSLCTTCSVLPVPWNSRTYGINGGDDSFYGSFINPNTTVVYNDNGIVAQCQPKKTISNCAFKEDQVGIVNFPGVSDVGLRIDGFPSSANNEYMNYSVNYLEPNYNYINLHSGDQAYYHTVFTDAQWNAIRNTYLQLPSDVNGTAPPGNATYQDWANLVYDAKAKYYNPQATVMENVVSLLNAMSPSINSDLLGIHHQGGAMDLNFDVNFWVTQTRDHTPVAGQDYPYPGQDYVNWFLDQKVGLSSEFAAALTMILRAEGIPARFVTGYALGNTTDKASTNPYVTVYQRLHQMAWTEVLVPIRTDANVATFEWMVADPIGGTLAAALGMNLLGGSQQQTTTTTSRVGVLDPFYYNNKSDLTTTAGQLNFLESQGRVGVDQKNSTNQYDNNDVNDNGVLESNGPKTASVTKGTVHVSVMVARFYYTNGKVTSITPAGSYPVTFQVLYFPTVNQTTTVQARYWNQSSYAVTTTSDPVSGWATVTFQYLPFNPDLGGLVPLHGTSPISFIAILNATETVNMTSCRDQVTGAITCGAGYSDTNKLNDIYDPQTGASSITYDPFQLIPSTGAPMEAMSQTNTKLLVVNTKVPVNQVNTNLQTLKMLNTPNLKEATSWSKATSRDFLLMSIFYVVAILLTVKIMKKK